MVEVFREGRRDAFPSFVRRFSGEGCGRIVRGWRGRNGPHQRCWTGIVFDDNFVANAHMIQTR
jgi:hypothetical protein